MECARRLRRAAALEGARMEVERGARDIRERDAMSASMDARRSVLEEACDRSTVHVTSALQVFRLLKGDCTVEGRLARWRSWWGRRRMKGTGHVAAMAGLYMADQLIEALAAEGLTHHEDTKNTKNCNHEWTRIDTND